MPAILAVYGVLSVSGIFLAGFLLGRKRYGMSLLVFFLLTPAALIGWHQATTLDRVAAWLYPSDTVYSSGFSPQRFRRVAKGMSERELLELLGQPLERRAVDDREEVWCYSRHGTWSQNYWNYIVMVDPVAGNVVDRFSEFYTD
jgi:hypothetical protein